MTQRLAQRFAAFIILGCCLVYQVNGQDEVVVRRSKSNSTLRRKGQIEDWTGSQLLLNTNQRKVMVDNEDVVSVRTSWPIEYQNGIQYAFEGRTDLSIQNFQAALKKESRPWAQVIIRSKLIGQLMLLDQVELAIQHFQEILQQDPNTRFVALAPLAWSNSDRRVGKSEAWLDRGTPMLQLIGASWSLNGPGREKAIKVLEELVDDIDPRISSLAKSQLWRTRINVSQRQLQVWQESIQEMPRPCQAGPRLVIAGLQLRASMDKPAVENWMKVVTLHPEQPPLVAESLFRLTSQLMANKRPEVSTLSGELKTRYPQSKWARQLALNKRE